MIKINKINKKGVMAISQILILVIGIIAFVGMIGGVVGEGLDKLPSGSQIYNLPNNEGQIAFTPDGKVYTKLPGDSEFIITQNSPEAYYEMRTGGALEYIETTGNPTENNLPVTKTPVSSTITTTKTSEGIHIKGGDAKFNFGTENSKNMQNFENAVEKGLTFSEDAQEFYGIEDISESRGKTTYSFGDGAKVICDTGGKNCRTYQEGSSTLSQFFSIGQGTFTDAILSGAQWAGIAYGIGQMIGSFIFDDPEQSQAFTRSLMAGAFTAKGLMVGLGEKGFMTGGTWEKVFSFGGRLDATQAGMVWGGIIAVVVFAFTYEDTSQETITFKCYPWDAPVGGEDCEKCNNQPGGLPCSEYQCRSLGQACELLNPGTDEERCEWVNRYDVEPPVISAWEDALLPDYEYDPDNTISPPDYGVKVVNTQSTTGCAKAFTPLSFGLIADEPARCKLDYDRKESFDEMNFYFGDSSLHRYNHTQVMSLPGPGAESNGTPIIQNNGEFTMYARCMDANGNTNPANFVFKFCVEQGPDTTPPVIVTTNLLNSMPIAFNQTEVDLEVYVNEPAECKWSHLDQDFDDMEETMDCETNVAEINAQLVYTCKTTLTGLKSREENKFYFRCKDQPLATQDRNENAESYLFTLIGTQPLVIDSVGPNGTVKDSTESVKVTLESETSAGYKEGEATCYYSDSGEEDDYIMFFNTNSYTHSQDLYLAEGDYEYFIKCIDLGGNQDLEIAEFHVESDSEEPIVVRAYHEESYLKLITNEKAECVFDNTDCSYLFEDGTQMSAIDETSHFTDWNTNIDFYIKCKDEYGNQPNPDQCSMIVRPFEIFEAN